MMEELRKSLKSIDKKLLDKADESDLDELRQFINVMSVNQAGGGGGKAAAAMPVPSGGGKESKKIKELAAALSDIEERVSRNSQDVQKFKDIKERHKQLEEQVDAKADLEGLKNLMAKVESLSGGLEAAQKELTGIKKLLEDQESITSLERTVMEQGKKQGLLDERASEIRKAQEQSGKLVRELELKMKQVVAYIQKEGSRKSIDKGASVSTGIGMVEEERFVALKEVVEATEKELKAAKDGLTKRQEALEIALTTKLSKDMLEELEGEKIVKIRPCGDSE